MKILSNKEYDSLIIEIEFLKEVRKNDDWCIDMLTDKINQLEEENEKMKEVTLELMGERDGKQMRIDKLKEDLNNLQAKYDLILELYNKYGTTKGQSD